MLYSLVLWPIEHQFILGMTDTVLHSIQRDSEPFLFQNSVRVTMPSWRRKAFSDSLLQNTPNIFRCGAGHVRCSTSLSCSSIHCVYYHAETHHLLQGTMFEAFIAHSPLERFCSSWQWHSRDLGISRYCSSNHHWSTECRFLDLFDKVLPTCYEGHFTKRRPFVNHFSSPLLHHWVLPFKVMDFPWHVISTYIRTGIHYFILPKQCLTLSARLIECMKSPY